MFAFNAFFPSIIISLYVKGDDELFIEDLVNEERSKRQGNKQKKKQKNYRNKQKNKSGMFVNTYIICMSSPSP